MRKVNLLRGMGVLCSAAILAGSVVSTLAYASDNIHFEEANTAGSMTDQSENKLSSGMKKFYKKMMDSKELQEGDTCVLETKNGEEFCVEVTDAWESGESETSGEITAYTSDELSPELEEFYKKMMDSKELQKGDVRILDVQNGEEFCVEVTDACESQAAAYSSISTTTKTFSFYKKNVLGVRKNLFEVTSTCDWIKGSKITNLHCSYTTLTSGVSCSWNDNYKKATDVLHTLALDVTYSGDSYFIIFGASLSADLQSLTLDCSEDYESQM